MGIYIFSGCLAIIILNFPIVLIHIITGFNAVVQAGKRMQIPLAEIGILITIDIIPIIGIAIVTLLFAIFYDIKGEKKVWLEEQLRAKDLHK
jgi:hypothetical protein